MQYLDRLGWPVERIKGRWFLNILRLLIHTRKIKRGSFVTQMTNKQINQTCQEQAPSRPTKA